MKDSSPSGQRKGRNRNYNNKNRNKNRRHVKQKVPRRAKKKSIIQKVLELFGIGKPKKKPTRKKPTSNKNSRPQRKKVTRPKREHKAPEKIPITTGRLYVGNLPYKTTDEELKELFNQAGETLIAEVVRHRRNNRSKGYAFVEMADAETAQKAASQMNEYIYLERKLIVNGAKSAGREEN